MIIRHTTATVSDGTVATFCPSPSQPFRVTYLDYSVTLTAAGVARNIWWEIVDASGARIATFPGRATFATSSSSRVLHWPGVASLSASLPVVACPVYPIPDILAPAGSFLVLKIVNSQVGDAITDIIVHVEFE